MNLHHPSGQNCCYVLSVSPAVLFQSKVLLIHLITESLLLDLFPHCLRNMLLMFIGNQQWCFRCKRSKSLPQLCVNIILFVIKGVVTVSVYRQLRKKKKIFRSCDHLDIPLLPPWWLFHVSHHFTMLSSQRRQRSAEMWKYRFFFMHEPTKHWKLYTHTQIKLCVKQFVYILKVKPSVTLRRKKAL